MQNLIVVESPAKSKTIGRYLNDQFSAEHYKILATGGHIYESANVDIDNEFELDYVLIDSKKRFVNDIIKEMRSAERLYLATDPDREGEAISAHVFDILDSRGVVQNKPVHRIIFHEVTGDAIRKAIAEPTEISHHLVQAQKARDALDQLVGFNLSKLLIRKLSSPGLSAGRVQSPALRMIVERQREINRFDPEEYWTIQASLQKQAIEHNLPNDAPGEFKAALTHLHGKKLGKLDISDKDAAAQAVADIQSALIKSDTGSAIEITSLKRSTRRQRPSPPYVTSTLVQDAASKFNMSAKATASVAQRLYEGVAVNGQQTGLITYTRTDSTTLSSAAIKQIREYIAQEYHSDFPDKPRIYKTKSKSAQEAHEAIRPTNISLTPNRVAASLDPQQLKIYRLIWNRTVMSQMNDAVFDTVTVELSAGEHRFKASGSTLKTPGWMKLNPNAFKKDNALPPLEKGEIVDIKAIEPQQHFTEPPARFTTASLIKRLEELGIGRPSTWPTIITKLQNRNYVEMEKQSFVAKGLGCTVVDYLLQHFAKYIDYQFTSNLEDSLDKVANGDEARTALLTQFWAQFKASLHDGDEAGRYERVLGKDSNSDRDVLVRVRKGGAFLQIGRQSDEVGKPLFHSLPQDFDPESITLETAMELFSKPEGPQALGHAADGAEITVHSGRYGPYFSAVYSDGSKVNFSFDKNQDPHTATMEDIELIMARPKLPLVLGKNPDGEEVIVNKSRFGPYVALRVNGKASSYTTIPQNQDMYSISLDQAMELIANKSQSSSSRNTSRSVIQKFSGSAIQVLDGRYGPYATDGKTNASIPQGTNPQTIKLAQCEELIKARAAKGPQKPRRTRARKKTSA